MVFVLETEKDEDTVYELGHELARENRDHLLENEKLVLVVCEDITDSATREAVDLNEEMDNQLHS